MKPLLNSYIGLSLGTFIYALATKLPAPELAGRLIIIAIVFAPLITIAEILSRINSRR